MKVAIFSFSSQGAKLARRIEAVLPNDYRVSHFPTSACKSSRKEKIKTLWASHQAIIFISATGIAVRLIASFVQDKKTDPAILCMDDSGKFVIPLLSGHLGGANVLANRIAKRIDALAIITTATDNRGIQAPDLFAKANDYRIDHSTDLTRLTALMVEGEPIGFYSKMKPVINYPHLELVDIDQPLDPKLRGLIIVTDRTHLNLPDEPYLILRPKTINIGIGARKGVATKNVISFIQTLLAKHHLSEASIAAMGTIDLKKEERGIIEAATYFDCPLRIFTAEELQEVAGRFKQSEFVRKTTKVTAVSAPSAYLLGGDIIEEKAIEHGITLSLARKK